MLCDRKTGFRTAHKFGKFLINYLNNHLTRSQVFHNIVTDSTLGNFIGEFFCYLVVYIGFEKCKSHLTHSLFNICLGKLTLGTKFFK